MALRLRSVMISPVSELQADAEPVAPAGEAIRVGRSRRIGPYDHQRLTIDDSGIENDRGCAPGTARHRGQAAYPRPRWIRHSTPVRPARALDRRCPGLRIRSALPTRNVGQSWHGTFGASATRRTRRPTTLR